MVKAVERSKESEGAPLVVFPEGTRHHDPKSRTLLPFKKGAFIAAVRAKVSGFVYLIKAFKNIVKNFQGLTRPLESGTRVNKLPSMPNWYCHSYL